MTERSKRMLAEMDPSVQQKFEKFLERLDKALGEERYMVYEGRRSKQVQEAYYAQGRETLERVNKLRQAAGLYLLAGEKHNYIITYTLKSKHLEGFAMDVVPTNGAGNPTWDMGHYWDTFITIRNCGRDAGLECGADWPYPQTDWPHYEVWRGE